VKGVPAAGDERLLPFLVLAAVTFVVVLIVMRPRKK
jgi:hypothetical protein